MYRMGPFGTYSQYIEAHPGLLQTSKLKSLTKIVNTKIVNSYNHGHDILRLFDTLPNFFSPRVKGSMHISNKHGIYELPHELPNDLRLRILGNW